MDQVDTSTVEIIRSSLVYACEEMGIALRNSAYSPNIRERMDHSTAIFDSEGRLLAQAEHIPVHLGSLPLGLNNTIEYCHKHDVAIAPFSMIMVNNPYIAGTHLNDVTVIRPVFNNYQLIAYTANKAHHSDVGGKVPGSISIDAETLFEEGVVINPIHLVRKNRILNSSVKILTGKSRTPVERSGDLRAQTAANRIGERRILELTKKHGVRTFRSACHESLNHTEILAQRRLTNIPNGDYTALDHVEDPEGRNISLKVTLTLSHGNLLVDYTGTDRQVSSPLNAAYGVTLSGIYYVTRTLIGDDIPANDGTFKPITVKIPTGTILNPTFPHPVAGGNLETSQRNADLLYSAFSQAIPQLVPAQSGGSMNNVMMGGKWKNETWTFYETIGVGLGGKNWDDGIDGIQANMTNTMNTPIEEIERSYPLQVEQYELRANSCGQGRNRGGTGIIRSYRILANDTTVTILADRFRNKPMGLLKGKPGAPTEVAIIQKGEKRKILPVKCTIRLQRDDIVEIRTAGGGGYGNPQERSKAQLIKDFENGLVTRDA
jgi:N-methylhydantoinase B